MKKDPSETKDNFIRELTKLSREEINEYIQRKGKEPKLARAFSYTNK